MRTRTLITAGLLALALQLGCSQSPAGGGNVPTATADVPDAADDAATDSGATATDTAGIDTGMADGSSADADTADGGGDGPAMVAQGGFTTVFDGKTYTVDYSGKPAKITLRHRINTKGGPACVPEVEIEATRDAVTGTCRLKLRFETNFDGVLELTDAEFHAKSAIYQDEFPIEAHPCDQFADMSKYAKGYKPAVFKLVGGSASLEMAALKQPAAGRAKATLTDLTLAPKGKLTLRFGGKALQVDLGKLTFTGTAISEGSAIIPCAPTYNPVCASTVLKDINPASPTHGQDIDLCNAYEGNYLAVLMGAGWDSSSITQVEHMQLVKESLEQQGRSDFRMVVINDVSASSAANRAMISGKKKKATFPVLQAVAGKGWTSLVDCLGRKGKKNDGFVFAPDGRFIRKHEGKGVVYMNIWKEDLLAGMNTPVADLDGCQCSEFKDAPTKRHHVLCKK